MGKRKKEKKVSTVKDRLFKERFSANLAVDKEYGNILLGHMDEPEKIAQNILLYIKRIKLTRLLTYYELFKPTIDLPGDIVELGVFRGESLLTFARMLECFSMGDRNKMVYGFDHFKGLQDFSKEDGKSYKEVGKNVGGWCGGDYYQELKRLIELFDADRFVPLKQRIVLVEGDVKDTVPQFVRDNSGIRISLLHFDLDLYEPTKVGLEHLYDKVVPGGVIIFDEYSFRQFAGETIAADEFFKKRNLKPKLSKFPWFSNPGAYFFKE
ncbi:MAG: TylF/MycF/NovP-related O-methyltransferase [bacterium]